MPPLFCFCVKQGGLSQNAGIVKQTSGKLVPVLKSLGKVFMAWLFTDQARDYWWVLFLVFGGNLFQFVCDAPEDMGVSRSWNPQRKVLSLRIC